MISTVKTPELAHLLACLTGDILRNSCLTPALGRSRYSLPSLSDQVNMPHHDFFLL